MIRHCDGTDDNLIRIVQPDEVGDRKILRMRPPGGHHPGIEVPCDCGLRFDDVERMVIYPHGEV